MYSNGGIFLSTHHVQPALRNAFWQAVSKPISDVYPKEVDGVLCGSSLIRRVGGLTVAATRVNRQQYVRSERAIASGRLDHYLLQLVLAGTMTADCGQDAVVAGRGDICIFDLARPYVNLAERGKRITVAVPRERIDQAIMGQRFHGVALRAGAPLSCLLRGLIMNLYKSASKIDSAEVPTAEAATIDFIAAVLGGHMRGTSPETHPEQNLRRRVLNFIDTHLADPELGADALTQQFQISRAHLYRVFAADGGVASVIRKKRLDLAYRRLKREGSGAGAVTRVAYELGFPSSGQFSRAFRSRFGLPPSQVASNDTESARGNEEWSPLQSYFAQLAKGWPLAEELVGAA